MPHKIQEVAELALNVFSMNVVSSVMDFASQSRVAILQNSTQQSDRCRKFGLHGLALVSVDVNPFVEALPCWRGSSSFP